jgi:hypothetical protein
MLVEAGAVTAGVIPPALRDGYEVHRAALRHGLDVTLYPRQVMMARPPGGGPELSFVHGVPESSTLAAVTYAQDKRMRRELLQRAGLPVPEGASFAIGREFDRARQFATTIGYPVVVKPAVGDNMNEVLAGLRDQRALTEAISYLRTPEIERPTFTRAAYALTLLLEPDEEEGRAVAPAGYQFLLERHVCGEYLRLLVLAGELVSALHLPGGLPGAADRPNRDVTDEIHPSLRDLAMRAAAAVPGLAVVAVDVVLTDHQQPVSAQPHWIVELSERPWLAAHAAGSEQLSRDLGEAILGQQARASAVTLPPARDKVAIRFRVDGATDPDGVVTAIATAIDEARLAGIVDVADRVDGTVAGTVDGDPGNIAHTFELLLAGQLHGQRGMLVEQRHL